jgi:hypothetical protein
LSPGYLNPSDGIGREMKMAKIIKRKLRWKASRSAQTTGYKLYWARQGELSYSSAGEYLGQVTEVVIPDGLTAFTPGIGPFEFGVVAVDDSGNESDMTAITVPFHFIAPEAPEEVQIEGVAAQGEVPEKHDKVLELRTRSKPPAKVKSTAQSGASVQPDSAPAMAVEGTEEETLEFFETDRADAGVMFTKEDLEIFESDLKL